MKRKVAHIPTTVDLLEEVRTLIAKGKGDGQPVSDYRVAKVLGMSPQRISRYFRGVATLDDDGCQIVAQAIDWPLETVLACVYLERSKRQEQDDTVTRAWQRICQHVAMSVVFFCVGFSSVFILPL